MPVEIRPLSVLDKAQWQDLWTAYLGFYGTNVSAEIYETTFDRLLGDDPRDFSCLVAVANDQLVGLTHYLFHRHAWKTEDVCYLQDLYATPETRGTGVGRALIEAVYAAADQHGTSSVYWLTQSDNTNARQLYDRIGELTPFLKYQRAAT
ncbi:N-acetyltransferase family protein [Aestuariibius sp. HNIBRBA575]|uniref:GNAT family N-acetyltransferase n=1 Tax=Aestuariibius sp. HNIBRBA575 TaxID=3233343 RepID=UPI0034A2FB0E